MPGDKGLADLYRDRSEYIVTGLVVTPILIVVLGWIQFFSNLRRAGKFTEDQFLIGLFIAMVIMTIGVLWFLFGWVRGKPRRS